MSDTCFCTVSSTGFSGFAIVPDQGGEEDVEISSIYHGGCRC